MKKLSVASSNVKWPLAAVTKHSAESWESVTERLEKLRCVMRLNKKQFAESVGMRPQNWGNVMKGRSMLPVSVAIRACLLTGADLDYIYRGDAAGLAPDLKAALLRPRNPKGEN